MGLKHCFLGDKHLASSPRFLIPHLRPIRSGRAGKQNHTFNVLLHQSLRRTWRGGGQLKGNTKREKERKTDSTRNVIVTERKSIKCS